MRNKDESFDLLVTGPGGKQHLLPQVVSVSADSTGVLHVHDANGPLALFSPTGWHSALVNGPLPPE